MDTFLDTMEQAVAKRSEVERKQLQQQLDSKAISASTFKQKQRDIEKWVSQERREISDKRSKV